MGFSKDVTITDALQILGDFATLMLSTLNDSEEAFQNLLEAKGGDANDVWARRLYLLQKAGPTKLTVDATARTIACLTGANLFTNVPVGGLVNTSGFLDVNNNVTDALVTARTNDLITLGEEAALVNEIGDGDELVEEVATADQIERVDAMVDAGTALHDLYEGANNVALGAEDRSDLLRAISTAQPRRR